MRGDLKKIISLILTVAMVLSFTSTMTWAGSVEEPGGLDFVEGMETLSEDGDTSQFQDEAGDNTGSGEFTEAGDNTGSGEFTETGEDTDTSEFNTSEEILEEGTEEGTEETQEGTEGETEIEAEEDTENATGSWSEAQENISEEEDGEFGTAGTEASVPENTETVGEEENKTDGEEEIESDSEEAMEAVAGTAAEEDVVEEPAEDTEPVTEEPAAALASVPYLVWDDDEQKLVEMTGDDACTSYFLMDSSNYAELDAMEEACIGSGACAPGDPEGQPSGAFTWVVIDGEVTFTKRIKVLGTANVILKDGAKLAAGKGITVAEGDTLNIYAQSEGDGKGELYASAYNAGCDGAAGIGGYNSKSGTIVINGGKITAIASYYYSAGIGGGMGSDGGSTTINGGHVTATGYDGAAGIGGGTLSPGGGGTVTINGGTLSPGGGGTVTINGGVVVAKSNGDDGEDYGVGIGGGGGNSGSGTLILGENVRLYEGSDNTGSVLAVGPVDNVTSRAQEMYAECVLPAAHVHSFAYTAEGAVITAECTAEGCDITEGLTLTISAPSGSLTYDGSEKPALLSTGYEPLAFPDGYSIVYETGGVPVDAPVNAGDYTASVTVGEATASVSYSIEKRPVTITADDQVKDAGEADPELTVTISGAGDMACDFDEAIGGEFDNSSNYPWSIVEADGRTYAQSGNAGIGSSSSTLSLTVTVAEGSTVSFDYKIMGEGSNWDTGRFLIDGTEKFRYGAQLGDTWKQFSSELTEGEHTLTWTYSKDSSVNPTGDFFAIDNFVIVGVVGGGGPVEGETLSYTVSREEGDTAGSYPINVIPGENPNYEVTAVPGTLYVHEWSYQAEGATITAKCAAEGCNITEGLTMTISAPAGTLFADGTTAFPATLNDDYNTTAFPGEYAITYTRDGEPYEGVPTEAGEYVASVTVGGATASVRYSVHGHSFTYNADGATATASCGNEGCDITTGLTMTISAPAGNLIADGTTAFPATLNDDYNTTAFPGEYAITYTREGEPYDGVPTEAGHYEASVTVGDCVISVSYGIHELVPDGEGNHGYACDECGETFSEPCSFETAATENGNARLTCSLCGYSKVVELGDTYAETWDFNIDPAGSWIFVDADNDGKNWCWSGYGVSAMDYLVEGADISGNGRNGGDFISSASYSNRSGEGVLYPDNWAISPAVSTDRVLSARLSFYAQAQDASYPS